MTCLCTIFSTNLHMPGTLVIGLKLEAFVGSSFLNRGITTDFFQEDGASSLNRLKLIMRIDNAHKEAAEYVKR